MIDNHSASNVSSNKRNNAILNSANRKAGKKSTARNRWIIALIVVLVVFGLGCGLYWYFFEYHPVQIAKQEMSKVKPSGINGDSDDDFFVRNDTSPSVEDIVLDKTTLLFSRAGEKKQLTATVLPADVSEENRKIVWKSDNDAVATVDTSGLVTALANGQTVIRAYTKNGLSHSCSVQVKINQSNAPTPAQLNDLLKKITNSDDQATDRLRSILGNSLRVEGATNISNVQQLITDVSNGSHYKVTKVNTNDDGKIISITVSK